MRKRLWTSLWHNDGVCIGRYEAYCRKFEFCFQDIKWLKRGGRQLVFSTTAWLSPPHYGRNPAKYRGTCWTAESLGIHHITGQAGHSFKQAEEIKLSKVKNKSLVLIWKMLSFVLTIEALVNYAGEFEYILHKVCRCMTRGPSSMVQGAWSASCQGCSRRSLELSGLQSFFPRMNCFTLNARGWQLTLVLGEPLYCLCWQLYSL